MYIKENGLEEYSMAMVKWCFLMGRLKKASLNITYLKENNRKVFHQKI